MGEHKSVFYEAIVVSQVTYHDGLDLNGSNWGRQNTVAELWICLEDTAIRNLFLIDCMKTGQKRF